MARLTISLPDALHQALREAAARRGHGIGEIVAESLVFYGIKTRESARELVLMAGTGSKLSEAEGLRLAVKETRRHRADR